MVTPTTVPGLAATARMVADLGRTGRTGLVVRPGALSDADAERVTGLPVVAAVADGRSNQQVARALSISERTVARHLANVYLKTQVVSRTGAVAWARERGLL